MVKKRGFRVRGESLIDLHCHLLPGIDDGRPRYWAERMFDEGLCHVLATDAHNTSARAPHLAEACDTAAKRVGEREAMELVFNRALGMIDNVDPSQLSIPRTERKTPQSSLWSRVLTSARSG